MKNNQELINFGSLNDKQKSKIKKALIEGKLEVHCPWWAENHWEEKHPFTSTGEPATLWGDAFYRIREND
jgi:hypothetical protein